MPNGKIDTMAEIQRMLGEIRKRPKPPPEPEISGLQKRLWEGKAAVLTSSVAKEMGLDVDFPEDWMLRVSPGKNGEAPVFTYRSPEGIYTRPEDIMLTPEGGWTTRQAAEIAEAEAVVPTFEQLRLIEREAGLQLGERLARETQADILARRALLEGTFKFVFPDVTEEEIYSTIDWMGESEENLNQFLTQIQQIGRTNETENLLKVLFPTINEEDFQSIFPTELPPAEAAVEAFKETPWLAGPAEWSEAVKGFPGLMDIMQWLAPTKVGAGLGVAGAYLEKYVGRPWEGVLMETSARLLNAVGQGDAWTNWVVESADTLREKYGWAGIFAPDVSYMWDRIKWQAEQQDLPSWALTTLEWLNPAYIIPIGGAFGLAAKFTGKIPVIGRGARYVATGVQTAERGIMYPVAKPLEVGLRYTAKGLEKIGARVGEAVSNRIIKQAEHLELLMELPASDDILKGVLVDNWMKKTLQIASKIPPLRVGIERGLGWRILTKLEGQAVEDIVGRAAVVHAEIARRGINAKAPKIWELRGIEQNPVRLFGFNKKAYSRKMSERLLPEYAAEREFAGTLEHVFTRPEMYSWKGMERGLDYVTKVHEINTEILNLLKKEGVPPKNLSEDWWIHRVVEGKFDPEGELIALRGRPGVRGRRIGVTPSYEMHRKAPTMAEGIAWGVKYGRNPELAISTYIEEAFKKIADDRFLKYIEPFGITPAERLAQRYPELVERALLTQTELADSAKFQSVVNRAIRGEKIPEQTLRAMERRFPEMGRRFRALAEKPAVAENELRELLATNDRLIRSLQRRVEKAEAVDIEAIKAEARTEAIRKGIPDEQKLREAFKLMEYDDRLAFRNTMNSQMDDIERMVYEQTDELKALQEAIAADAVAQVRVRIGTKKVGTGEAARVVTDYRRLEFFISIRERSFPDYFTVKQAQSLNPGVSFEKYTQKGLKTYNKVPRNEALSQWERELNMSADEIAERVMKTVDMRQKVADLNLLNKMGQDRATGIKRMLGILDDVDTKPELIPEARPVEAAPSLEAELASWQRMKADLEKEILDLTGTARTEAETMLGSVNFTIRQLREKMAGRPVEAVPERLVAEAEMPKGWRMEIGKTRTKEGITAEAEVDWQRKVIVFRDKESMARPEIVNHEIAHIRIEELPDGIRKALLDDYVKVAKISEWEVKNQFHREAIAIDYGQYLTDATKLKPGIRALFDKNLPEITIPKAPPGMPEAGVQKDIFGYEHPHFPRGKGEVTQIGMDDYAKLVETWKKAGLPEDSLPTAIKPKIEGVKGLEGEAQVQRIKYEPPKVKTVDERKLALEGLRNEVRALTEARKAPYWQARSEKAFKMEQVRQPEIGEGYLPQPFAGGRIFEQEFIDSFNKFFGHDSGLGVLKVTSDVAGILRITKAALDFSAMAIQGMPSFGLAHAYLMFNPVIGAKMIGAWYSAFVQSTRAFFDPGVVAGYMTKNRAIAMQRIAMGGSSRAVDYFAALQVKTGVGGKAEWLMEHIPLKPYHRAETSFFAAGEMVRDEFWRILSPKAIARGQEFELARLLDRMTGIIDPASLGVPLTVRQIEQSFLWFAPSYTRACLTFLSDVFRGGYTGAEARKALGGMIAAGSAMYSGVQFSLQKIEGKSDEEAWDTVKAGFGIVEDPIIGEVTWKPTAQFMTIKVGNYNFGIGGFWYGLLRLSGNISACVNEIGEKEVIDLVRIMKNGSFNKRDNPFIYWWYSRSSPFFGSAFEMSAGKDFLGYPIETGEEYAKYIATRFEPIWAEQGLNWLIPGMAKDNEVPEDMARVALVPAELLGMRTFPESDWVDFYDKANELIPHIPKEEIDEKQLEAWQAGTLEWKHLTEFQKFGKDGLLARYPELLKLYEDAQADSAVRNLPHWKAYEGRMEEERLIYYDRLEQLTGQLTRGEIDTREYREKAGEAGQNYGSIMEAIARDPNYAEIYDFFDKKEAEGDKYGFRDDIALGEFQANVMYSEDLVDDKGDYDWDERDRRVDDFIEKWGQETYDRIQQYLQQEKGRKGVPEAWIRKSADTEKLGREYWRLPYKPFKDMDEEDEAEGNIPAEYQAEWLRYRMLETDDEREAFLEDHPDIERDWRAEYRKDNPDADARLALWGYGGRLQTMEAYDLVTQWGKELGIPLEQMGLGLPPRSQIENYFEYIQIVNTTSGNSAEARLFRMENPEWETWAEENWGWKPPDDNIEVLRIKVKYAEQDTEYDAIKMDDDKAQREAREKYLEQNPEYAIARRRREAYQDEFPDGQIDKYVEYYQLPDKGYWRERFLLDNDDFYTSMKEIREIEVLDPAKIPVQAYDEIYDKWQDLFDQYADVKGTAKARAEFRANLLENNPEFASDRRRREAYGLFFPERQIENYAEYYSLERKGMEQELFLAEHPDFKAFASKILEWEPVKEKHIESLRISVKYRDMDDLYNSLGTRDERVELLENNPAYSDARRQREAYDYEFPDSMINTFVEYYKVERAGYEDDWYLMEHPDFYEKALEIMEWKPRDFSKVPTRKVYELYEEYQELPKGKRRDDYRWDNRDLDDWLLLTNKVSVSITEKRRRAALTPQERLAEELKDIEERLKERGESNLPGSSEEFGQSEESMEEGMNPAAWKEEYAGGAPHWAKDMEPSKFAQDFVGTMKSNKAKSVLEIGCGNGRDSILFAESGLDVTSVDITPKAVELATKNAQKSNAEIEFKVADAERLQFKNQEFDAVFTLSVLHSTELNKSIPEIYRVLKPGGVAFVYIYADTEFKSGKEKEGVIDYNEYLAGIKDAGFQVLKSYKDQEKEFDESGEKHSIFVVNLKKVS